MVDLPMLPYQKCALNQIKITTENDTKVTSTVQIIIQTVTEFYLFHPVSNSNTLRHQFESGKTQKTAGRRLSVAIGNTKVTIAITMIQF
jgi:non-canonical (house-cleaning) NTP pyrophosphatase